MLQGAEPLPDREKVVLVKHKSFCGLFTAVVSYFVKTLLVAFTSYTQECKKQNFHFTKPLELKSKKYDSLCLFFFFTLAAILVTCRS